MLKLSLINLSQNLHIQTPSSLTDVEQQISRQLLINSTNISLPAVQIQLMQLIQPSSPYIVSIFEMPRLPTLHSHTPAGTRCKFRSTTWNSHIITYRIKYVGSLELWITWSMYYAFFLKLMYDSLIIVTSNFALQPGDTSLTELRNLKKEPCE